MRPRPQRLFHDDLRPALFRPSVPWWWSAWVIFCLVGSIVMASLVVWVAWHFIAKYW